MRATLAVLFVVMSVQPLRAASDAHADPLAPVVAGLAVLLLAGKLGGELATRLKQPAVLGELVAGIVLGNLSFGGTAPLHALARNETIEVLAGNRRRDPAVRGRPRVHRGADAARSALPSLFVAVLGVVAPFALGLGRRRVAAARRERLRARVPRRHAVRDQRRHHRARAQGPRRVAQPGGAHHPRRGGHRRRPRPRHPRRRRRRHRRRRTGRARSRWRRSPRRSARPPRLPGRRAGRSA